MNTKWRHVYPLPDLASRLWQPPPFRLSLSWGVPLTNLKRKTSYLALIRGIWTPHKGKSTPCWTSHQGSDSPSLLGLLLGEPLTNLKRKTLYLALIRGIWTPNEGMSTPCWTSADCCCNIKASCSIHWVNTWCWARPRHLIICSGISLRSVLRVGMAWVTASSVISSL